jgi:FKBP-type peptidyl-prolyl cis-trans isomerase FkpA
MRPTAKTSSGVIALLVLLMAAPVLWAAGDAFQAGPGGMRFKDLQVGHGAVAERGMVATIHFIGWLDENGVRGREIYNSRREGRPVSFVIGTDGVMPGWNEGVMGMKPGGSRMVLLPPAMAYGQRQVEGVIPADAAMMFRIELLSLENPAGS